MSGHRQHKGLPRKAASALHDTRGPLYEPDDREAELFGDAYKPPPKFVHGEWDCIARFEIEPESDGRPVEVDAARWPATFYRLRVPANTSSIGQPKPAFALSTGSGLEAAGLVVLMAKAISSGMLDLDVTS